MHKTICELVRVAERLYTSGTPTTISKYVEYSLFDNNNKIDAYINSKFTSGDKDSLGRDKPFFNIVLSTRNIWYRATDIDRKNLRFKATKRSHYVLAFLANVILQEWMRKNGFGAWLNDWGKALATYGSSMTKFVDKGNELIPSVTPWNRLIVDNVDVDADIKIEKLYLTPAMLRKNKAYDQDKVELLLKAVKSRETQDGTKQDTKAQFIEVYEVHGDIEVAYLTENWDEEHEDTKTYTQQIHVVSFLEPNKNKGEKDYQEFTLYKGREKVDPNEITHLIKEDGRATSIGAVETLFEAQWQANHTIKNIKDFLDIALKIILQTPDETFAGRNALTSVEQADILYHKPNMPLTQVNLSKGIEITSSQNYLQLWQNLGKELSSTPDSMRSITPPSGTPLGTTEIMTSQGLSLFEIMLENKGMDLERIMRKHVLPFIKRQLDTAEEISAVLDEEGIAQLDAMYIPNEAKRRYNKYAKDAILNGDIPSPFQQDMFEQGVRDELSTLGNQRFFKPSDISSKTWKKLLADFDWENSFEVEITGESKDKAAAMSTLFMVLKLLIENPGAIESNPNAKMIFSQILEETGKLSPVSLSTAANTPAPTPEGAPTKPQMTASEMMPANPIGGSNGGGGLQ